MNAMKIFRLAYISRNLGHFDEAGLERLLTLSRRNNQRDGVTGALLFSQSCFAQVLEGPVDAVSTVFERIQCDERHDDIVVILRETAPARGFPDWSMAYAGEDAAVRRRFAALPFEELCARQDSGSLILGLLNAALLRVAVPLPQ